MKVLVQNQSQPISLDKKSFISSGGEGSIYKIGQIAYKVYSDPKKMISLGKVQELTGISDQNVIRPQNLIYDSKNKPIGYTMRFVSDTYSLVQLFTKAFRQRENLTHETVQKLVQNLKTRIDNIHKAQILVVDLNEMNFLVNKSFSEIYAIDTDSYQTPSYPATAIMDSIRDRHNKSFSELTDWFSFGIISFQMFIGIHPYKGKHNTYKNIDDRMLHNISVFNSDVRIPPVCYQLDVIPEPYRNWFKAVFEDGKRIPPPDDFKTFVVQLQPVFQSITGSNNFDITEILNLDDNIISIQTNGTIKVLTEKYYYTTPNKKFAISNPIKVCQRPRSNDSILAKIESYQLQLFDSVSQERIPSQVYGQELMEYNGNLYIKNRDHISLVEIFDTNSKLIVSSPIVASILENATSLFDGVVIQNLLGATYISVFPEAKQHRQLHIKELDSYRVIDAKYDNLVLMVIGVNSKGYYDRIVIRFSESWNNYDVRIVNNITNVGLNFVVLENGIVICINEEEKIEAFSNKINSANIKIIDDPIISSDMKLFKRGTQLMFAQGQKLFSMSMKK